MSCSVCLHLIFSTVLMLWRKPFVDGHCNLCFTHLMYISNLILMLILRRKLQHGFCKNHSLGGLSGQVISSRNKVRPKFVPVKRHANGDMSNIPLFHRNPLTPLHPFHGVLECRFLALLFYWSLIGAHASSSMSDVTPSLDILSRFWFSQYLCTVVCPSS